MSPLGLIMRYDVGNCTAATCSKNESKSRQTPTTSPTESHPVQSNQLRPMLHGHVRESRRVRRISGSAEGICVSERERPTHEAQISSPGHKRLAYALILLCRVLSCLSAYSITSKSKRNKLEHFRSIDHEFQPNYPHNGAFVQDGLGHVGGSSPRLWLYIAHVGILP